MLPTWCGSLSLLGVEVDDGSGHQRRLEARQLAYSEPDPTAVVWRP